MERLVADERRVVEAYGRRGFPAHESAFSPGHLFLVQEQARGDPRTQHQSSAKFWSSRVPKWWLFSGWNCTPWTVPALTAHPNGVPYSASATTSS